MPKFMKREMHPRTRERGKRIEKVLPKEPL